LEPTDLKYKIGISLLPLVGGITARKLIAYAGSAEAVFMEKKAALIKIPGIGKQTAEHILSRKVLEQAENEVEVLTKHGIQPLFYLDDGYPARLKHCADAPVLLYVKGNVDFNHEKVISIVGTRDSTEYGRSVCEKLISGLKENGHEPLIVSGLAYGIDVTAHKLAMKYNLRTVAVLGHGLQHMYPAVHSSVSRQIIKQGALVTEFSYALPADRMNFVSRNRIIAGLADATVVVESKITGGALITAELANSYNRDVFAIPGRTNDTCSAGCNKLIKSQRANLAEDVADLEYILGWDAPGKKKHPVQTRLFHELNEEDQKLIETLRDMGETEIDELCFRLNQPVNRVSASLLNLEFSGLVKSLPGKRYRLTGD
jgi:DNA processing protein